MCPIYSEKARFSWINSKMSSGEVGKKIYINGIGHMTKMAAMPIYGKNLLHNQKSYYLETWQVALGAQALQSLYK